jgi:hypothetical protein
VRRIGGGLIRWAFLSLVVAVEDGGRGNPLARAVAGIPRLLGMKLGTR